VAPPSAISVAVVGLTLLITFALGVFPQPLLDLTESAARFLT
jgi:NADH:ubiquinone oxidoreductase subunit 2 (subunit N)